MQNFTRTVKQMRVNFFVRIIDNRQKFRHQIDQLLPNLKDMGSDNTVQLRGGVFRRLCRRVNSPGSACTAPFANSADSVSDSTAGEPWHWISAMSSPV